MALPKLTPMKPLREFVLNSSDASSRIAPPPIPAKPPPLDATDSLKLKRNKV
jgi:hypothetical protein